MNVVKPIEQMEKRNPDELLKRIGRVEPPPFLFTRIETRIAAREATIVPRPWLAIAGVIAAVMLVANLIALRNGLDLSHEVEGLGSIAEQFGMSTSNQIYR